MIKQTAIFASLAMMTAPSAFATELFDNGTSTLNTVGWLTGSYVNSEDTDQITEAGSRFGLDFSHKIENDWTVGIMLEWAINFDNNSDISFSQGGNSNGPAGDSNDTLTARHGYVRASSDKWGTFSVGKQWAAFYDVTWVTDILNFYGGNASGSFNAGTDGGLSGTGRVEQAIIWRKTYGDLQVGLQFQAQDEAVEFNNSDSSLDGEEIARFGNGYGASLVYNLDEFNFGLGYNKAKIELNSAFDDMGFTSSDDESIAYSVTYGQWTEPGLYAAVVHATSENHETDDEGRFFDAAGTEVLVWYIFDNQFGLYGGLNHLEADDSSRKYEMHYEFAGVEYRFTGSKGLVYIETKFNDNTSSEGLTSDHTDVAAGFRVNF